ncbi:MAG: SDR family oxidoreductase [Propionibacteriaceae bacterium]|nr:SDR family oxidoreductase [Propionibacteriaceae bacterium]
MSVVIAGCGDLGTEAALRFAAMGHRTIGLRRTAEKLPREIEGQSVDLSVEVPTLPADTTIVVIALSPDERSVDGYRKVYVDSVRNMVAAIHQHCTAQPRVLFVSSTAVYGVDDGSWVDASTPTNPGMPTAVTLREGEDALLEQIPDATLLRLGGIYGPGRTREVDRVRAGINEVSSTPRFTNRIHRDDAAGAIVHLTTMQEAPHTVYIGVDDRPTDHHEVIEYLAERLGVKTPPIVTDPGRTREQRGKRCRNTALRESGFVFSYPTYREGYAAVLEGKGVRHP